MRTARASNLHNGKIGFQSTLAVSKSVTPEARRLFCFGCGYSARTFARKVLEQGWQVAGTSRTDAGVEAIEALGIEGYRFSSEAALKEPESALAGTTHLLSSVPPGEAGDPVLDRHAESIRRLGTLQWIGYLSATSVYGDRGGAEVSEADTLAPVSRRARKRAGAEAMWLDLSRRDRLPAHVFRLAGIYGPGRSAIDQVRAGTAKRIDKPGHKFSRTHVDDIARSLLASIARPNPGAIYNICDDTPATSAEVTAYACELLGVPPPPLVPFAEAVTKMSPMAREFWADNRRISNRRMRNELGVVPEFPDFRAGLRAILASETE